MVALQLLTQVPLTGHLNYIVTVRKTQTPFDHVLLTFGFDPAVTLTEIELDLFLCPELNTYAPFFSVYGNTESNFDLTLPVTSLPFRNYPRMGEMVIPHSCDSLSTVTIPITESLTDSFHTWHIVVSQFNSSIDWVHVGEVRFLGTDVFDPGMMLLVILSLLSLRVSTLVLYVFTKQYRHMQGHVLQNQLFSLPPSQVSLFHYQQPITLWTTIGTSNQGQPSHSSSVGDMTATTYSSCSKSIDHRHVSQATVSGECGTQLLPTSAPKERETCTAVIGVSSVSLLVIVTHHSHPHSMSTDTENEEV